MLNGLTLLGILNCLSVGFFVGLGWFTSAWIVSKVLR